MSSLSDNNEKNISIRLRKRTELYIVAWQSKTSFLLSVY